MGENLLAFWSYLRYKCRQGGLWLAAFTVFADVQIGDGGAWCGADQAGVRFRLGETNLTSLSEPHSIFHILLGRAGPTGHGACKTANRTIQAMSQTHILCDVLAEARRGEVKVETSHFDPTNC